MRDRFYNSHLTFKEVNTTIANKLNVKTPSAGTILSDLYDGLYYDNASTKHFNDYTKQKRFLEEIRESYHSPKMASLLISSFDGGSVDERSNKYVLSEEEALRYHLKHESQKN